jgi:hypothetical protein
MRWTRHAVRMDEMTDSYNILFIFNEIQSLPSAVSEHHGYG